ncbi:polysaccharide pyruvyl transferase family protein [Jiangella alkaliphila]|uniref:Polysaccharide pyruvyl transferase n=1 Tax=Jiangella alkaliphila TaxID=419479 RepID=A0A1H2LNX3_9ACTN|nr:polysaccharide pyruvyl transferase family protein [Jiangella alkaliphila]SDU82066.1 Polysaccharide pyruvyl transferase [Jiangella alkaliphila]
MKVGIITLPLNVNYGGIVQAFALKRVLERQGHDVWFIDRDGWPRFPATKKPMGYVDGLRAAYLLRKKLSWRGLRERDDLVRRTRENTRRFVDDHLEQSVALADLDPSGRDGFDALVVGSDQIWRPAYEIVTSQSFDNVFFSFAENWDVTRLSYAASFGVDEWELSESQTRRCSELLQRFDAVSVREQSGVALCRDRLGVIAEQVLDPTMLLDPSDYADVMADDAPSGGGRVFTYVLDANEDKDRVVGKVAAFVGAEVAGLEIGRVSERLNYAVRIGLDRTGPGAATWDSIVVPPIETWLAAFRDASFVVTDSFHGSVFAILFRKPFIVYANGNRGLTRFKSLLGLFGLEDRLITSSSELSDAKLADEIDWVKVDEVLGKERDRSRRFLDAALRPG